jgi:hypothetical protein
MLFKRDKREPIKINGSIVQEIQIYLLTEDKVYKYCIQQ